MNSQNVIAKITRRLALPVLLLATLLGATGKAAAQYDLSWRTIDGGGGTSSGGAFTLSGTTGQPDAGTLSGGTFSLAGGYWPGIGGGPLPPSCPPDIAPPPSGNGLVNIDDLIAVVNSWGPCAGCPADITGPGGPNGIVNIDDLLAVINAWGACP